MRIGADAFLGLFGRVVKAGSAVVRSGSGALGLAYVAAGRRDGYVENHINAWDCLAGIALVREAGGYVSDFLAGEGLRKGNADPRLRARRQGRAAQDARRSRGSRLDDERARAGERRRAMRSSPYMARKRVRWSVGGRDLLWPGDPAIWDEISPILYPVVGWTRDGARVGGRQYPLGLHGFARRQDFEVEAAGGDFARLTLERQCSDPRALSLRVSSRGRISP